MKKKFLILFPTVQSKPLRQTSPNGQKKQEHLNQLMIDALNKFLIKVSSNQNKQNLNQTLETLRRGKKENLSIQSDSAALLANGTTQSKLYRSRQNFINSKIGITQDCSKSLN